MGIPITASTILRILNGQIAALENDPENIEHAYICIVVAAHLPERVAVETGVDIKKVKAFRDGLEAREPALRLLRDLNNFAKHVKITAYKPSSAGLRSSDDVAAMRFFFSMMEDTFLDLDISGFQIETEINSHRSLLEILKEASSFWASELRELGIQ